MMLAAGDNDMTNDEWAEPPRLVSKSCTLGLIIETWANVEPALDGLHEAVTYTYLDGERIKTEPCKVVGPIR